MDDCFVLFNNKAECDSMFAAFNLLHPSINFTLEAEVENKLAFLDVQLERKNDKFITSNFSKKRALQVNMFISIPFVLSSGK